MQVYVTRKCVCMFLCVWLECLARLENVFSLWYLISVKLINTNGKTNKSVFYIIGQASQRKGRDIEFSRTCIEIQPPENWKLKFFHLESNVTVITETQTREETEQFSSPTHNAFRLVIISNFEIKCFTVEQNKQELLWFLFYFIFPYTLCWNC